MLYLSRLILNARHRHARQDLANVHELHRTILGAFPAAPNSDTARQYFGVLFRAEPMPDQPLMARVLVQSTYPPDWSRLSAAYLAPPIDERGNPAVRTLDDEYSHIAAGMTLRFRLRANPTQRIGKNNIEQKEEWRGKRVELRDEGARLAWLERKAAVGGFRLVSLRSNPRLADTRVSPQANVYGYRRQEKERPLTFGAALFEGLLAITDADRFQRTLVEGIGSGKAYGFGLLSIAALGKGDT